jgi:hypothetical protein
LSVFHQSCFDEWKKVKETCPFCRHSIHDLSIYCLRKLKDIVDWRCCGDMINPIINTVDLLREFQDYVDWSEIDYKLINSLSLAEEFKDKVIWSKISMLRLD